MGLSGKIVKTVEIISDGDVFHEIFRDRPHHISDMSPARIQGVDLHEGDWGTVGSTIVWNFTHDGKEMIAKDLIEAIDEANKSVTLRNVGGEIGELYKTFIIVIHVDTEGEKNLVTWTFEFEKVSEDVENPEGLADFCVGLTKDIEAHHLKE